MVNESGSGDCKIDSTEKAPGRVCDHLDGPPVLLLHMFAKTCL